MAIYKLPEGNTIVADAAFVAAHHPDAVLQPDIPAVVNWVISVYALKMRFTAAERQAIRAAAAGSAEIADFLDLLDSKTDGVNLHLSPLMTRLDALVSAHLLTSARAAEIRDTPPRDDERP